MAKTFKVEIVTPGEAALALDASALQAPAWQGYLGVLAGHAPLLTVLRPGVVTVRDEAGKPAFYAVKGGFMEVSADRTIILADAIEAAKDIDPSAAEKAIQELEKPPEVKAPEGASAADRQRLRDLALAERAEARRWAEARLLARERSTEAA